MLVKTLFFLLLLQFHNNEVRTVNHGNKYDVSNPIFFPVTNTLFHKTKLQQFGKSCILKLTTNNNITSTIAAVSDTITLIQKVREKIFGTSELLSWQGKFPKVIKISSTNNIGN